MNELRHYYLHVDLDAFFASVEQLDNPQLKGKPVIVGGKPDDRRSVVSTASYEARKFGVHSAMPVAKAYELCPQGIFVHGRMKRYSELSYQIMNIFRDFSPDVQQLSIDEAFIDLTGTEGLFGPPEQTALKIKERVKKETGLTVSAGLAPTKYLAKIASDMNKPDGFYKIEAGTEQEFMLALPLKKVWGIGDKTLESLKTKGLRTTRDIYEKSLESLTFMFGQNTGVFLYNVVRGIEIINFDRKTKSHSISNETTFPYDLTNIYTAETAILELCHSVIFRLLKENGFSRTVQVKIRYEDFTTVSIQQTFSQQLLTLDSLYNAAKELFERKYERGRGIRLIGIALENIENTSRPYQPSLFDDGSEKKQKVEKAILNLEKKHPEIKIHKARMLENLKDTGKKLIFIISLLGTFLMGTGVLQAQEQEQVQAQALEQKESTMEISGWWKGSMEGAFKTTFGMGNPFALSAGLPVFKQEVDLSALIHITPQLYFSLEFLDEFKHNTYTFGYNGNGWLKEFKLSNRGIAFPIYYSAQSLGYTAGGGENEAPGLLFHFEDIHNNKWSGDLILRYDMTETKTAVFYGNNSVKDIKIELRDYVSSEMFVIPSQVISDIKDVYIQSSQGTIKDANGIYYTRLLPSDYHISKNEKLLEIYDGINRFQKKDSVPYILITFISDDGCTTLLNDTGSYDNKESFAGKLQTYFCNNENNYISLSDYSDLSEAAMITTIEGQKAFIIQRPSSFSPYLCANSYSVTGTEDSNFIITDRYSELESKNYSVDLSWGVISFTSSDFFQEKTKRVYVYNTQDKKTDVLSPAYRFPLADKYPLLYLEKASIIPLVLVDRTLTAVKEYDIGKYADAGSVRVYRNGCLEADAVYDSGTGFVTLSYPAGELDKIYITYSEETLSFEQGTFTTGAGFIYNFTPNLSFDLSFTGKYPYISLDENKRTEALANVTKHSTTAFGSGIKYDNAFFHISDSVAAAFENENLSGILRASDFPKKTNKDDIKTDKEEKTDSENENEGEDEDETEETETFILPPANVDSSEGISASCLITNASSGADIFWTDLSQNGGTITALSYFSKADFSPYKTINLRFAITQALDFEFLLTENDWEPSVKVSLTRVALKPYANQTEQYHTLTINLKELSVFIDGNAVPKEQYSLNLNLNNGTSPTVQKIILKTKKESTNPLTAPVTGHLYLSELYYKDNYPFFTVKNRFETGLGSKESTGFIKAESEQVISQEQYINSAIKGAYTVAGINFSADASALWSSSRKDAQVLQNAGHAIQTKSSLFKLLDFGEFYRFSPANSSLENALEKKNYLRFNTTIDLWKLEFGAQTSAKASALLSSQNYSFDLNTQINTDKIKIKALTTFTSNHKRKTGIQNDEYFKAWYDTSALEFLGNENFDSGNAKFNAELSGSFETPKLSPVLFYEITTKRNEDDFVMARTSENLMKFSIPFTLNENAFSVNISHKGGIRHKSVLQKNDTKFLFQNQNNYSWYYTCIPFYSLFETTDTHKNLVKHQVQNEVAAASLSLEYELLWRRKLYNSLYDLFIPYSAGLLIGRDTVSTDTTTSDIYQLKGNLSNRFINGKEEYNGGVQLTYSFASEKKNSPVFLLSTTEKLLFYLEPSNILSFTSDFDIDSSINWKLKFKSGWERFSSNSLLRAISVAIWPVLLQNNLNTKVTDSINIIIAQKEEKNQQSWGYTRTSQMDFMKNYSITSGAGIKFGWEEGKTFSLALEYTLGAKISF